MTNIPHSRRSSHWKRLLGTNSEYGKDTGNRVSKPTTAMAKVNEWRDSETIFPSMDSLLTLLVAVSGLRLEAGRMFNEVCALLTEELCLKGE